MEFVQVFQSPGSPAKEVFLPQFPAWGGPGGLSAEKKTSLRRKTQGRSDSPKRASIFARQRRLRAG